MSNKTLNNENYPPRFWSLLVLVYLSSIGYSPRTYTNTLNAEVTPPTAEVTKRTQKGKINPVGPSEPPIWLEEPCY